MSTTVCTLQFVTECKKLFLQYQFNLIFHNFKVKCQNFIFINFIYIYCSDFKNKYTNDNTPIVYFKDFIFEVFYFNNNCRHCFIIMCDKAWYIFYYRIVIFVLLVEMIYHYNKFSVKEYKPKQIWRFLIRIIQFMLKIINI